MKNSKNDNVLGRCFSMCPAKEIAMRSENKLVHRFEKDENGKPSNLIKEFRRSAAGHFHKKPNELRPPVFCLKTARYLMTEILFKHGLTKAVYHFVFDRLRSIRQDLIVQDNPDVPKSMHVLQICVRFHLLASYKLSIEQNDHGGSELPFDKEFNFTQLLECLKDLLVLYEMELTVPGNVINGLDWNHKSQIEAYAIYLIINLGSQHSINWGYNLPSFVRNNQLIGMALSLNGLYREKNFVRFFRLFKKLPIILKLAAHWNLPHVLW